MARVPFLLILTPFPFIPSTIMREKLPSINSDHISIILIKADFYIHFRSKRLLFYRKVETIRLRSSHHCESGDNGLDLAGEGKV